MMNRSSKRGFTLVELLVVIAIIGILVALLLPAVQSAREAARRMQCSNNLKQLGLALHLYHDAHKTFPPGAFWYGNSNQNRGSILIQLLPYIEQQNLYNTFDFKQVVDSQTLPNGQLLTGTMIPTYRCPSDNNSNLLNGLAIHNYAASKGSTKHIDNGNCSCSSWASFNNFGLAPYDDPNNYAGPFSRMGVCTTMGDCRDGLSNTIYFGEVRRDCSVHIQQGWARSNNGNGLISTVVPINYDSCKSTSTVGCERPCNWNTELAFKSQHTGGAQFVLGDGSVHFITDTVDMWVYQYLGSKADGKVFNVPW